MHAPETQAPTASAIGACLICKGFFEHQNEVPDQFIRFIHNGIVKMIQRSMSVEEFLQQRIDLPDGGQWSELIRGVPVSLSPPDLEHGTIVLNFSKALSQYVHATEHGYPCFDLGLQVEQAPDTVYFPAISYFLEGARFAETDFEVASRIPALVVELTTTTDRRKQISERIIAYQELGIETVWVVDPRFRSVHICRAGLAGNTRVDESELLKGEQVLPGFEVLVSDLFEPPEWSKT